MPLILVCCLWTAIYPVSNDRGQTIIFIILGLDRFWGLNSELCATEATFQILYIYIFMHIRTLGIKTNKAGFFSHSGILTFWFSGCFGGV